MKMYPRTLLRFACLLAASALHAQTPQALPEDLFNHLYWSVKGTHANQSLGATGLDTIGYISPSIKHAFALGADGGSGYVFNELPRDTARHYKFPGQKVIRGNLNGDAYPDFVCWDEGAGKVTVLLGTIKIDSFDTALVLMDPQHNAFRGVSMVVARCDSDSYDDLVISDGSYEDSSHNQIGQTLYYRGGSTFNSSPAEAIFGKVGGHLRQGAGNITAGYPRSDGRQYILQYRYVSDDTNAVLFYRLGSPTFHLKPIDTILCTLDTARYCCLTGGFAVLDYDGDGIDEILFSGYDNDFSPNLKIDPCVFAYKGGPSVSSFPTYVFHRPFQTNSATFGSKIVDLGNATGLGYHTLLISDPDASVGGLENGAVFLFNIGKALKDACVGYAAGLQGFHEQFGSQAIPLGDVDGDGLADFAVGANVDSLGAHASIGGVGEIYVFHGSARYVGVDDPSAVPTAETVLQNYPNPFSERTTISFVLQEQTGVGSQTTLSVYDMLGREVARPYAGRSDGQPHMVAFSGRELPTGEYVCRLTSGNKMYAKSLFVLH